MKKLSFLTILILLNLGLNLCGQMVNIDKPKGIATNLTAADYLFDVKGLDIANNPLVNSNSEEEIQVLKNDLQKSLADRAKLFMVACGHNRIDSCDDKAIEKEIREILNKRSQIEKEIRSVRPQPQMLKHVEYTYFNDNSFKRNETEIPNPRYAEYAVAVEKEEQDRKSLKAKSIELALRLLEEGVDVNAVIRNYPFAACANEKLHKYSIIEQNCLGAAILSGSVDLVESLIELGAKIESRTVHGTALHFAVKANNLPVVELLIKKGASLEARVQHKKLGQLTCLQIAQAQKFDEIAQLLIDSDANQNAKVIENDKSDMDKALEKFCCKQTRIDICKVM